MGLALAQTLGNAGQAYEDARKSNIAEQQQKAELGMRQQQLARTLQLEMIRLQLDKARQATEEGRYAAEQERLKNAGWSKVGQDYQQPDGTWKSIWYNPGTGETREKEFGTPRAVVQQDMKGDQAQDLEKLRNKDKLEQIAASGRWHMKWSELAAQGKLKKEDWNYLKTDPGYIQAIGAMKNAMAERNTILSRMYNTQNPPSPNDMAQLNTQLQQVEQRLQQSATTAEQTRNRIVYKVDASSKSISDLKDMVGAGVQKGDGTPKPPGVPDGYIHLKSGSHGPGWYAPGTS